jgi:hypothetical protein
MGSHIVHIHWMYQDFVLPLAWWWLVVAETCCYIFNFADLIHVVPLTVIKLLDWNNVALYLHRLSCIIAVFGRTALFVAISCTLNGYDIYGNHSNGARFHSPPRYHKSSHHCIIAPNTKELRMTFLLVKCYAPLNWRGYLKTPYLPFFLWKFGKFKY